MINELQNLYRRYGLVGSISSNLSRSLEASKHRGGRLNKRQRRAHQRKHRKQQKHHQRRMQKRGAR